MSLILAIIIFDILADLLWWWWADRRARTLPKPLVWRLLIAAFAIVQLGSFLAIISARLAGVLIEPPAVLIIGVYLWHLLILPTTVLALASAQAVRALRWMIRHSRQPEKKREDARPLATRRNFLTAAAAVSAPMLLTGGSVVAALQRLRDFRIRRLTIALATLPPELDGLTIAHLSDIHVGRFTRDGTLRAVAEATNNLRPDLVLMTGDLIDFSLSDLPAGIDMLNRLSPRYGLYMCEGNHDLFESRREFEQRVQAAGIPLLLDSSDSVRINGQAVQILGSRWGSSLDRRDASIAQHVWRTTALKRDDAFPILLAHHPHSFDIAASAGIPLTLSGHTHGGQLMLTDSIGVGPMMFRYWSGLYRDDAGHALVVSNGIGNWFPLRINAPAEILHLTLRRAAV